ncbi:uncharacterized protein LOC113239445 isoform X2 [Hyposmocoma kahamanoa]|uniref:uncharacterized protein LOC113239445 isoform X2 n=1 Tax=Hyposmocoma kahamanoa TaxID=1477025 RepID=UPI000E6D8ACB|nr:uncharacterized protein LOC113239445 isoform X2 [Hyposmocoma kahamanoa]
MEGGGKQSRLLGRLLGKLRGDHHRYNVLDRHLSVTSSGTVESMQFEGVEKEEEEVDVAMHPHVTSVSPPPSYHTPVDEDQFPANIDLRYGGQYLTPEQLPEFCDQLHNLVEVIRNIQSYAKVTGEYPSLLERRLEQEAQEVAALAAEARNARDVISRIRVQRRAVRVQRKHLATHLATLKDTEVRELESTVRLSDRKLFKSWESLKDSSEVADFEPLLSEIKNKQTALECLIRLIDSRRTTIARHVTSPQPLPPPLPRENNEESNAASASNGHRRQEGVRRVNVKRRRKEAAREPRSVPLSGEPSHHGSQPQVTLFIQGTAGNEHASRYRVGSAGAVTLTPLELPSRGSVRDILFFTS